MERQDFDLEMWLTDYVERYVNTTRFARPPFVVADSELAQGTNADPHVQAFAAMWYYVTYFSDRLMFSGDLRYQFELLPAAEIMNLFQEFFHFKVEKVIRHPRILG